MDRVRERWRSYLLAHCESEVAGLAGTPPGERSLTVDLLALHEFDSDLARAVFEEPTRVLAAGTTVLEGLLDGEGAVKLRVENNPQQFPVSAVRARHHRALLTVDGVVETVGPVRARAAVARYDCPACGDPVTRRPVGVDGDPPVGCGACEWDRELPFRPGDSTFVDLQRVELAPPPDAEGDGPRTDPLAAYLDGSLVGSVATGDHCRVTGVLRVHGTARGNEFAPYLDGLSVREERDVSAPADLESVLDSMWDRQ